MKHLSAFVAAMTFGAFPLLAAERATSSGQKQTTEGAAYATKPRRVPETGRLFYWLVSPDRRMIVYEPCTGVYWIQVLSESATEFVFTITQSAGTPIDLKTGQPTKESEVVGKRFAAKLKGNEIISVAEVK